VPPAGDQDLLEPMEAPDSIEFLAEVRTATDYFAKNLVTAFARRGTTLR
jgi:hypothetical protein